MVNTDTSFLRAEGNLSYLQFIRLVEATWREGAPDIPIVPRGGGDPAEYPCIVYHLESRTAVANEPKARHRETIEKDGKLYVILGQRFQNLITFTAVTKSDADDDSGVHVAEQLIEMFEDFMLRCTGVFKKLGVSDIFYHRRYTDREENRNGFGIVRRSVSYLVTLERVIPVEYGKLEEIYINLRTMLQENKIPELPEPYQRTGPLDYVIAEKTPDDLDYRIVVPGLIFKYGTVVYLMPFSYDYFDRLDSSREDPIGLSEDEYAEVAPGRFMILEDPEDNSGYRFASIDDEGNPVISPPIDEGDKRNYGQLIVFPNPPVYTNLVDL